MQCRFSFKHMATSEALTEYTESKVVHKIERFSSKPIDAHITFSVEGYNQIAHCSVRGGDGCNFEVESQAKDMYAAVDVLVDKMSAQLKKLKEKVKSHHKDETIMDTLPQEILDPEECDDVPVDAADLLKLARSK